jgi:hypothetical protein
MPGAGTKQQHISQQHQKSEPANAAVSNHTPTAVATASTNATPIAAAPFAASEPLHKSPDEVLSDFARLCVDLPATGALIALRDLAGLRCTVSFGNAPAVGSRLPTDSALASECMDTGEVALCDDAEIDPRIPTRVARFLGFRSAAAVPILAQGSVVGFIEVFCFEPFAISPAAVTALQGVAKSFAMQMILDAASGGQSVVGGPLDNPIVLPRLTAEQASESPVPKAKAPESIAPDSIATDSIAPKTIAPAAVATPAASGTAQPESPALKASQESPALREREIPRPLRTRPAKAASPAKPRTRAMLTRRTGPSGPTTQASSLAQLPSDRPIPTRVYVIAAAILLAVALLLLFLFRGATPRDNDPEALFWRDAPHAALAELFVHKSASLRPPGSVRYDPRTLTKS